MTQIIFQRILLSSEILLAFILAVKSYGAYSQWKVRSRSRRKQLPINIETGNPVLLYFWTPDCAQCKPQERQIEHACTVLHRSGRILEVRKFQAHREIALTKSLNVLTVPTTVLLDSEGNVAAWNPGLTQARKIVDQYRSLN